MELKGKKAMVMVEQMYNDYEFVYPYYRLLEAGAHVDVVGPEARKTYPGKGGTAATSTLAAKDADPKNYAGIVIPGGFSPDFMRRHEAMVNLVREIFNQGKVGAAIYIRYWRFLRSVLPPMCKLLLYFSNRRPGGWVCVD